MSCSVNLVPRAWHQTLTRSHRRSVWVGVCVTTALLVAAGWGMHRAAVTSLNQIASRVYGLEVQRTDSHRKLVAANAQRDELLSRLRTVVATRRPQPWARRIVALTEAAPDGLFLSQMRVAPVETPRPAPAANTDATAAPATRTAPPMQTVTLLGLAVDHTALIHFITALQDLPDWSDVELIRATQEPFGSSIAVAFEVSCKTEASRP